MFILCYLLNVMCCGCINSFHFHLNYAKHMRWSWFEALSCKKSKSNVQIDEIRHSHAKIKHGRAWPKMPQTPNVGVRHGRATFEYYRATLFSPNSLIWGTAMPKLSMAVPPDDCSSVKFCFSVRTMHNLGVGEEN